MAFAMYAAVPEDWITIPSGIKAAIKHLTCQWMDSYASFGDKTPNIIKTTELTNAPFKIGTNPRAASKDCQNNGQYTYPPESNFYQICL